MNFARKSQEKVRAESGAGIDNDSGVSSTMQPTESKIILKLTQYNQIQFSLVISAVQFMYRIQLQFIDNSNNQYRFYKASLMSAAFPPLPSFVQTEQKCCCTTLNSIKAFCGYNSTSKELFLSRNMEIPIQKFFRESSEFRVMLQNHCAKHSFTLYKSRLFGNNFVSLGQNCEWKEGRW